MQLRAVAKAMKSWSAVILSVAASLRGAEVVEADVIAEDEIGSSSRAQRSGGR